MDSEKAPGQLRLVLMNEHPLWKLPERRVARYLKRHLKARKNPQADEIEADLDEQTVFTTISATPSASKDTDNSASPMMINDMSIPEDEEHEAAESPQEVSVEEPLVDEAVEDDTNVKEDETVGEKKEEIEENEEQDVKAEESTSVAGEEVVTAEQYQKRAVDDAEVYAKDTESVDAGLMCFGQQCVIS